MRMFFKFIFVLIAGITASSLINAQTENSVREFTGLINNKLPIRMRMEISGNTVKGIYYYQKIKQNISIKGSIRKINDAQNKITEEYLIEEFDEKNNKTGVFKGSLVSFVIIKGVWSTPDGIKSYPFVLYEVQNNFKGFADINGYYDRGGDASIDIILLSDGRLRVKGSAVFFMSSTNIHTGEFEGIAVLKDGIAVYKSVNADDECQVIIKFIKEGIEVEDNLKCGGLNVTFTGAYVRKSREASGLWNE